MRHLRPTVLTMLLTLSIPIAASETTFPIHDLSIKGIYASRTGDLTIYCLLGGSICSEPQDAGLADSFISAWLSSHPDAVAVPISTQSLVLLPPRGDSLRQVYVWIESPQESLNEALVRQGFFPGQSMSDMVDDSRRRAETLAKLAKDVNPLSATAPLQLTLRDAPENQPRRLISDSAYDSRMKRVAEAEQDAKRNKRGMWSEVSPAVAPPKVDAGIANTPFPAGELYVNGISAHRLEHPDRYCLIGGDYCVYGFAALLTSTEERRYVADWLTAHPNAKATPISDESLKVQTAFPPVPSTYVWIDDGSDSLNLALIREGISSCRSSGSKRTESRASRFGRSSSSSFGNPSIADLRSMTWRSCLTSADSVICSRSASARRSVFISGVTRAATKGGEAMITEC